MPQLEFSRLANESAATTGTVQVLDRRLSAVYNIPASKIIYTPDAKRLVLCERFDHSVPMSCRFSTTGNCRFVHADVRDIEPFPIHIAYTYRCVEECNYERHELAGDGATFAIREPASAKSNVVDQVSPCLVLKTRCVFNSPKRPAYRCAHFYYGRECHLGSHCDFAHVIHVDPSAQSGEKAPLPSQFGRGREGVVPAAAQNKSFHLLQKQGVPVLTMAAYTMGWGDISPTPNNEFLPRHVLSPEPPRTDADVDNYSSFDSLQALDTDADYNSWGPWQGGCSDYPSHGCTPDEGLGAKRYFENLGRKCSLDLTVGGQLEACVVSVGSNGRWRYNPYGTA